MAIQAFPEAVASTVSASAFFPPCQCNSVNQSTDQDIKTALISTRTIAELCPIIRHAEARLSFWGKRYIEIRGYTGITSTDELAGQVIKLVKQNRNFDEQERSHGKRISPCITALYEKEDQLVRESNYVTRLFVRIRDLFDKILRIYLSLKEVPNEKIYPPRIYWFDDDPLYNLYQEDYAALGVSYHSIFERYTAEQRRAVQ